MCTQRRRRRIGRSRRLTRPKQLRTKGPPKHYPIDYIVRKRKQPEGEEGWLGIDYLVKWEGYEKPTWQHGEHIPAETRAAFEKALLLSKQASESDSSD